MTDLNRCLYSDHKITKGMGGTGGITNHTFDVNNINDTNNIFVNKDIMNDESSECDLSKIVVNELDSSNINSVSVPINNDKDKELLDYHKLSNKWVLWSHLPNVDNWDYNSYINLGEFIYLEELIVATELMPNDLIKSCMFFLMKNDITPLWEDKKNINGGSFSYKISNKHVCEVWRNLTYVLIGDTMSNNVSFMNKISGMSISPKKNFCIIKIWLSDSSMQDPEVITAKIEGIDMKNCIFKKHLKDE